MHRVRLLIIPIVLLTAITALAQPRLPITWGAYHVFMPGMLNTPPASPGPTTVYVKGDTICLGYLQYHPTGTPNVYVRITGNGGNTWSPWRVVCGPDSSNYSDIISITSTSQGIYVSTLDGHLHRAGLYRTTNLGQTWISPTTYVNGTFPIQEAIGDTIIAAETFFWFMTTNGGQSYSPLHNVFTQFSRIDPPLRLTATHQWLYATERIDTIGDYSTDFFAFQRLSYNNLNNGPVIAAPHQVSPHLHFNDDASARFDEAGNGVMCYTEDTIPPAPDYCLLYRITSHDFGNTWTPREQVTPVQSLFSGFYYPSIRNSQYGRYWMICWYDSTRFAPHNGSPYEASLRISFSANNGYSWFPTMEALVWDTSGGRVDTNSGGPILFTELRGNRFRIFGKNSENRESFYFYWVVEGTIHPDTINPQFDTAYSFAQSVRGDSTYNLFANASDNDSLWRIRYVLKRVGRTDSLVIPLNRDSVNHYSQTVFVRPDTAEYIYYYIAEDYWENRGYYPTNVPTNPPHFWVGPVSSVKEHASLPIETTIRAFPNPVNGMITFTGHLSTTITHPVKLHLYNRSGALAATLDIYPSATGNYRAVWDCRNTQGITVASGVYFAKINSGIETKLVRFSIVR